MKCLNKTSSKMEMIIINSQNDNISDENNIIFQNCEDQIQSSNIMSNTNNFEKKYHYLINLKQIFFDNYNTLYGNFLHIYFIIVFEILFYLNYIINIEYRQIEKVLKYFANDLKIYLSNILDNIPNNQNDIINQMCNTLNENYLHKNNEELKQKSYHIIWTLSTCLILVVIMHYLIVQNLKKLIYKTIEAIIFISFIALFEYYFFTEIIIKYHIITSEQASCLIYKGVL